MWHLDAAPPHVRSLAMWEPPAARVECPSHVERAAPEELRHISAPREPLEHACSCIKNSGTTNGTFKGCCSNCGLCVLPLMLRVLLLSLRRLLLLVFMLLLSHQLLVVHGYIFRRLRLHPSARRLPGKPLDTSSLTLLPTLPPSADLAPPRKAMYANECELVFSEIICWPKVTVK